MTYLSSSEAVGKKSVGKCDISQRRGKRGKNVSGIEEKSRNRKRCPVKQAKLSLRRTVAENGRRIL